MVIGGCYIPPLELYEAGYKIAYMDNNNKKKLYDARLIASAPSLYWACKLFLQFVDNQENLLKLSENEKLKNIIYLMKEAVSEAENGYCFDVPLKNLCKPENCSFINFDNP